MTAFPPINRSASSMTGASVESMTIGSVTWVLNREMISRMSRASSRPTNAAQTSTMCAPSFTASFPIAVIPSQSSFASRSRNSLLPFAFVRSPTRTGGGSMCRGAA